MVSQAASNLVPAQKPIHVAVGIILDEANRCLIAQRNRPDAYFGQWEFPGGKLEPNESVEHALQRELFEELGITVNHSNALLEHEHHYPDRHVKLHVRTVTQYSGEPVSNEGQAIRWITLDQIDNFDFLSGNQVIIEALKKELRI